jgi:hypothetical protein
VVAARLEAKYAAARAALTGDDDELSGNRA